MKIIKKGNGVYHIRGSREQVVTHASDIIAASSEGIVCFLYLKDGHLIELLVNDKQEAAQFLADIAVIRGANRGGYSEFEKEEIEQEEVPSG